MENIGFEIVSNIDAFMTLLFTFQYFNSSTLFVLLTPIHSVLCDFFIVVEHMKGIDFLGSLEDQHLPLSNTILERSPHY